MKIRQRARRPILTRLPRSVQAILPIQPNGLGGFKRDNFRAIDYFFLFTFTGMLVAMIYISETTPRTKYYVPEVCKQFFDIRDDVNG